MTGVTAFLSRARLRMVRQSATAWAFRGAATAAIAALLVELAERRWPVEPVWPALAGCLGAGLLLGVVGWLRAWPSWAEVAMRADRSLAGEDRLATALEFAAAGGYLAGRQRQDAVLFASRADLARLVPDGRPIRILAVAGVAAGLAAMLALTPNPALDQLRRDRADAGAKVAAIDQIGQLVKQAEAGRPGEDPVARRQLVEELQKAEQQVKQAQTASDALAALSQAQDAVKSLPDPNLASRQQAAQAAGRQLQQSPASAAAGRALANQDNRAAASELGKLAQSIQSLSGDQKQALAASLAQAAAAAQADPKLAGDLQKAADALKAGNTAEAESALSQGGADSQQLASSEDFQGDVAQASNGLQETKNGLAQQASKDQAGQPGAGQPAPGSGTQPGSQAGGNGLGAGPGQGPGQGGSGQGNGGQGASGGAGSGGGQGGVGGKPPGGSEKVYVPSQATAGSTSGTPGDPNSAPADSQLVPYDQVLAEYRSSALSQVDREIIPQAERDLVRSYFSELGR